MEAYAKIVGMYLAFDNKPKPNNKFDRLGKFSEMKL